MSPAARGGELAWITLLLPHAEEGAVVRRAGVELVVPHLVDLRVLFEGEELVLHLLDDAGDEASHGVVEPLFIDGLPELLVALVDLEEFGGRLDDLLEDEVDGVAVEAVEPLDVAGSESTKLDLRRGADEVSSARLCLESVSVLRDPARLATWLLDVLEVPRELQGGPSVVLRLHLLDGALDVSDLDLARVVPNAGLERFDVVDLLLENGVVTTGVRSPRVDQATVSRVGLGVRVVVPLVDDGRRLLAEGWDELGEVARVTYLVLDLSDVLDRDHLDDLSHVQLSMTRYASQNRRTW